MVNHQEYEGNLAINRLNAWEIDGKGFRNQEDTVEANQEISGLRFLHMERWFDCANNNWNFDQLYHQVRSGDVQVIITKFTKRHRGLGVTIMDI